MNSVPEAWLDGLQELAVELLGQRAQDPRALAAAVAQLSDLYTRKREQIVQQSGQTDALWARLAFFLPRDLPKVQLPLRELQRAGALPTSERWRVLDLGAGLGATSLGLADFMAGTDEPPQLMVDAVDQDGQALQWLERVARTLAPPGLTVRTELGQLDRLPRRLRSQRYDLILMGLALNEMADRSGQDQYELVKALCGQLAPGGSLVLIEPALRDSSRRLHALRDRLAEDTGPVRVFAPCVRRGPCPMLANPKDWCHERVPMELPPRLAEVAEAAGLRKRDLSFSYLTLHHGDRSQVPQRQGGHALRVVSAPLLSKGKLELQACGEHGLTRLMLLDRHRGPSTEHVAELGRGSLAWLDGVEPPGPRKRLSEESELEGLQHWPREPAP